MGLLREQCAEWKKVHLRCCCSQVWMKIGGQIPWNAVPFCETFKISFQMGRPHLRDVLENHLKDRSFRLVHWFSVTQKLRTSQDPSIWKESLTWIVPRIHSLRGGNLEGWRTDRRPWVVGNDGRIWNLLEKTQCKRGEISQTRRIYFSNRRWTNQNPWRRSGTENIHLDTGAANSRRKSRRYSWRIRRVSSTTSWLISGCRWSNKWFLVHVPKLQRQPSRWTKSQTLLAEKGIIPYSTEIHWRLQNYSHKFGCQPRASHWWLLGCRWIKRFVWLLDRFHSNYFIVRKTSKRIYVVREEINEKAADIQARSFMAELWTKLGRNAQLKERQKWSHEKP